jgi:putative transposase
MLRLPYLALTGVFAFLRLLPTSNTDKEIEILVLRHQLTIPQRQISPRAFLAALLHRIPKSKLRRLHLIISPDTVLRWHRDLLRRRHARTSRRKRPGRPPTTARVQSIKPWLPNSSSTARCNRRHSPALVQNLIVRSSEV